MTEKMFFINTVVIHNNIIDTTSDAGAPFILLLRFKHCVPEINLYQERYNNIVHWAHRIVCIGLCPLRYLGTVCVGENSKWPKRRKQMFILYLKSL